MEKGSAFNLDDEMAVVSTGNSTAHKEDFEVAADRAKEIVSTTSDLYAKFTKLIYLIDISSSMQDGLPSEDKANIFIWTDDMMAKFRAGLENPTTPEQREAVDEIKEGYVVAPEDYDEDEDVNASTFEEDIKEDSIVQEWVLQHGLHHLFRIDLQRNPFFVSKAKSKLDAVKDNAKKFVEEKFAKYGQAQIHVMSFDTRTKEITKSNEKDRIIDAIDKLWYGGGTDIFKAVMRSIEECENRPSVTKTHHVVLISDGLDYGALSIVPQIPRIKQANIVFDFIYVRGRDPIDAASAIVKAMKEVCEATGGEFTDVGSIQDFQKVFANVSARLCLPPKRD